MFTNKNKKNKKAISILVSYVLLITLAIALAAGTYYFLRTYAEKPLPEEACPEGTNIVVENYSCMDGKLDIKIKNRGLHAVTGVYIKISNETDSEFLYDLWDMSSRYDPNCNIANNCTYCFSLDPGQECSAENIPYSNYYDKITRIMILPYKKEETYTRLCKNAVVSLPVNC